MNNHGVLAGSYKEKAREYKPLWDYSIYSPNMNGNRRFDYERPIIIDVNGLPHAEKSVSGLSNLYSADTGQHEIVSLNDNGDYLIRSSFYQIHYEKKAAYKYSSSLSKVVVEANGSETFNNIGSYMLKYNASTESISIEGDSYVGAMRGFSLHLNNSGQFFAEKRIRDSNGNHASLLTIKNSSSNVVNYHPMAQNHNNLVFAYDGTEANYRCFLIDDVGEHDLGDDFFTVSYMTTPGSVTEPLVMLSYLEYENIIAVQKKVDAESDELRSIHDGRDAFQFEDISSNFYRFDEEGNPTLNQGWSDLNVKMISDNGLFYIASARNVETDELHELLLLKVEFDIHDEDGNPQIITEEEPANIPVNGDFDEEKKTNGRYVRDYEDASLGFVDNSTDLKTDDLRGCVVNIPGLDDSVWQNTTLKIRKKAGVIDPETNEEEAGEIRIHAINGSNQWVEVPLDTDLAPEYYVSTGQYANYDSCWFEGIKDGPITIEVEVVINSGTPILVEKKAMICTEKTKAEWQQEVWDDMQLLYSADLSTFNPNASFSSNENDVMNLYNYYGATYSRVPDEHLWMGIGKLAGATVVAGLLDAESKINRLATPAAREAILAGVTGDDEFGLILLELAVNGNLTSASIDKLQSTLMGGAKDIFFDLAWQFKAYHTSGLCALQYTFDNDTADFPIDDWSLFDTSAENNDSNGLNEANENFARREQRDLIDATWDVLIADKWAGDLTTGMFTYLAKNPTPGSLSFVDYYTANPKVGGNPILFLDGALVSDFDDRFTWFTQSIYPDWIGKSLGQRIVWADESVVELSDEYRADRWDLVLDALGL